MKLIVIYLYTDNSKFLLINIHVWMHTCTHTPTLIYSLQIYWTYFMHQVLVWLPRRKWYSKANIISGLLKFAVQGGQKKFNEIITYQLNTVTSHGDTYSIAIVHSRGMWLCWEGWKNLFYLGAWVLWYMNKVGSESLRIQSSNNEEPADT